ncbi:Gor1p [Sugiyamaella lignohabitans]|uniref:Gor1p n=1 Tax=Sugiyamaella lignohabitans TaxID=796027 RepID=A0A167D7I2_9ASCO|nr:Gor1p [Sugiyamaella lignohabitans]ANB12576.1 Gor1p [Sugiyamaella lignohabitans]
MTQTNKLLLLGKVIHAKAEYQQLSELAELVEFTSKTREEFISDLHGKYSDITAIYNTHHSDHIVHGIDQEIVSHFPESLKFVCHNGAGYDSVDVKSLTGREIQLSNTPQAVANATANTAIYLILGALRNFNRLANELRRGNWCRTTPEAHEPTGKVLGILGLGGIGSLIRDKAATLGFDRIIYHNRRQLPKNEEGLAEYVTFDELLAQSDVLSLSLPLNPNTRHIIDAGALSKCKDGVVIVNTSRGAIIDEKALVRALDSGKVSSAGLDVFEKEPEIDPGLLSNENILLLPHVGTHAVEPRKEMELTVIRNLRSAFKTGKVVDLVPEQVKSSRL